VILILRGKVGFEECASYCSPNIFIVVHKINIIRVIILSNIKENVFFFLNQKS